MGKLKELQLAQMNAFLPVYLYSMCIASCFQKETKTAHSSNVITGARFLPVCICWLTPGLNKHL